MPSPIAHTAVGYTIYQAYIHLNSDQPSEKSRRRLLITITSISLLPDLDSLFGITLGDFGRRHNNISHSLVFGTMAGLVAGTVTHTKVGARFRQWFLLTFITYFSHLWLDYWSTRRGIMLLWPFSKKRFASPVKMFYGFRWNTRPWSTIHLWTVLTELLFAVFTIVLTRQIFSLKK